MADSCAGLSNEIAALRAEVARLRILTEAQVRAIAQSVINESKPGIIQTTKSALEPGIASAVAGGVVVAVDKLKPSIDNAVEQSRQTLERVFKVERTADNGLAKALKIAQDAGADRAELARISRLASTANTTANEASYIAGTSAKVANNAFNAADYAEKKAALLEKQSLDAFRRLNQAEDIAAAAARESSLSKGLSNQAITKSGQAISEVAKSSKAIADSVNEISGLRGLVNGLGARVDSFGRAIANLETKVGNAITSAAKAVGISEQALGATGRLLGRVAELFQIVGTFATLAENYFTLETLGGRIDAIERETQFVGDSVSRVLGKLLGLQNRIGKTEADINIVRDIAVDARSLGEAAKLQAGAAQVTAVRAENFAQIANANAKTAQTTADGAVRNATIANENATTAYKKATEAQGIGEQAKRVAGDALGKAGTALTTALTALTLYQFVKGVRGIQGIPGIPGIPGKQGERGIQGIPGKDGVTTVVTLPGTPGRDGKNGINGLPGKNGRDGKDVNPADVASLKALIIQQHASTRTSINATSTGLVNGVKVFFTTQLAGITTLITAIANNTYVEKALSVLTFAATIHNALMLSNNLAQTLGTIIDQVLGFILPKGLDGNPISINNVIGKAVHEIIADTVGEANYQHISEDWAKANRIYQASVNVFNQIGNAVGLVTAGMEVIGGNVANDTFSGITNRA
ncbi:MULTISPECIES: hypothetical protein [unclassified Nostoc]|uniref:hypothetical protein n=1 Tax=unclassified Nostoc TaxID=2593658 RepID=UPI002AD2EDDF|nr:hypothetical protein [Nostoc sp. DedQUE03]MDZ7974027.1 hypothetical protein [Nostoc sp. DedQUE03]MDZ8048528.1 hypothetical protein [Nostoc sp. DedQUE02]